MQPNETEGLIDTQAEGKTIVLIGWSGLTGGHVLDLLEKDTRCNKIVLWGRKIPKTKSSKVAAYNIDPDEMKANMQGAHAIICCLGTTIKKAGSQEQFKAVDYALPLQFAQMAADVQISKFCLMSSVGADANSSNFYLKTKGQLETGLIALNFFRTDIFRPSLLLGKRNEFRLGERIAMFILPIFNIFLFGKMAQYKSIKSAVVAKAMVTSVMDSAYEGGGVFIHHYKEMNQMQ